MNAPALAPKWQNPFISRINQHQDTIFTCARENPAALQSVILPLTASHQGLILELCSGSGGHLIELAAQNPSYLCIGIELRYKRIVRTAEKAKLHELPNLKLLQVDAQVISEIIPNNCCDQIYINFPDPWDGKNRWEDKYLLSKEYLGTLANLLKEKAGFNYKTDHQRRFNQVHSALQELGITYKIMEYSEDLHNSAFNSKNIPTEFERLFSSQKKPVFYLKAIKSA